MNATSFGNYDVSVLGPQYMWSSTLGTCSDEGVIGDSVGSAALLMHFIEQLHGQLPVARLLTGADKAAVCDHTALTPFPNHLLENLQCKLTFVTGCRDDVPMVGLMLVFMQHFRLFPDHF